MRYALAMVLGLAGTGCLESHGIEVAEEDFAAVGKVGAESSEDDGDRASDSRVKGAEGAATDDPGGDDSDEGPAASAENTRRGSAATAGAESEEGPVRTGNEAAAETKPEPGTVPTAGMPTALTYYRDVKPIIDEKCAICHLDGGIAPMPFTSHEEVTPYAGLMALDIEKEIMPPWLATGPLDKYVGDRRLSPEQKDTLLTWLRGDLKIGDPADEPQRKEPEVNRRLQKVDLELALDEPYQPQVEPDDYRCFVFDWPYQETKYITALDIVPDNRQVVHHSIVYHVRPEQVAAARERDAAEEGPGYSCFGGVANATWLTSYEPGGYATEIPGNLGFEIEPGSAMILQMHYNVLAGDGADRSHVEFTVEDEVDRVGRVSLIMNPLWYIPGFMSIPMGQPDVIHSYRGSGFLSQDQTYEIFWADMHMHVLGSQGRIGIDRASGDRELLLDIPRWDFAWQETFILRESVLLHPGDRFFVECHFDNTAENQAVVNGQRLPPRDVSWGDGTTDEMCLGNVLIAPIAGPAEEVIADEAVAEEVVEEEAVAEEVIADEAVAEDVVEEEAVAEEVIADEAVAEEVIADEAVAEEVIEEDIVDEEMVEEEAVDEEEDASEDEAEDLTE